MSLIERPRLLFLDEPTTGLDPRSREQLWTSVRRLVDDGVTILLTTQYLEEADRLADTIAVLDRGRIVARGSPREFKASVGTDVLRLEFGDIVTYEHARETLMPMRCDPMTRALDVATDGSAAQVLAILGRPAGSGNPALKVSIHRPNLEEVFLSLTSSRPGRSATWEVA